MKSKKIGLYFGSFNPIHIGHLILANYMQQFTDMEEVWLVVSPHNPFKKKESLLDDYQRLNLVNIALEDYPFLLSSNIEFSLPQPSYTIDTLAFLKEKYPEHQFSLIMGQDNLASLHKWKNADQLIQQVDIYIYPRLGEYKEVKIPPSDYHLVDAPIIEISSTAIRKMILEKKNYRPYLSEGVYDYIFGSNLYQ